MSEYLKPGVVTGDDYLKLIRAAKNGEYALPAVNVVGTNSKASMACSLKAILNEAGYKCNLYTSPHLQSYTERYIFNDKEISEDDLIKLLNDTEEALGDNEATVFEILTCAFYKYAENYKDNINII